MNKRNKASSLGHGWNTLQALTLVITLWHQRKYHEVPLPAKRQGIFLTRPHVWPCVCCLSCKYYSCCLATKWNGCLMVRFLKTHWAEKTNLCAIHVWLLQISPSLIAPPLQQWPNHQRWDVVFYNPRDWGALKMNGSSEIDCRQRRGCSELVCEGEDGEGLLTANRVGSHLWCWRWWKGGRLLIIDNETKLLWV